MSEILSQEEVDALLAAIQRGELKADELRSARPTRRVRTYDFRRAMRFSKDHIRIISRIHEHFARLMTTHLSGQLRSIVQFQVESVDQVPYEEFIRSIPTLTVMQLMEFEPLEGKVVVEINPQIVFAMIDRMMGGVIHLPYHERELTEIELALVHRILDAMCPFFAEAWRSVVPLSPRLLSIESNPQFLQLATPNDTVLVIALSVRIGPATGLLNICVPHATLEPVMSRLSTQYFMDGGRSGSANDRDVEQLQKHLYGVPVDVSVQVGQAALTVEECLELQAGDVVVLSNSIQEPVQVFVDGIPAFRASIGTSRGRYAVQVAQEWKGVNGDVGREETFSGGD
ncbi:flagellar motor switch protein FliM [Alicyclobacillus cycloheptanicus]|uniref:Flagellar motor switch protein FliM n=1 Tax=Alicyclobacillus cycloheptanicus TaxID=1457 RepID=A0ABT9XKG8_9BACL|nr:flagellar motor switch protein FliM [Alicyclobacillus cycloheptanicus]MDQ0190549.1 flagellar motor switch protein FliM [Alicyclobacillus cycloheptanicus]WDM01391.1 flagellar motor switch protein FliM [Alicyclobacillus cycloheptanicus]